MISIKLEIASNGVIKTTTDDNYNGAGSEWNTVTVYETDDDSQDRRLKNIQRFLFELCDDLGVNRGNRYDSKVLNFEIGWGDKYEPNLKEINDLIKFHREELKDLKEWKKDVEKQTENDPAI